MEDLGDSPPEDERALELWTIAASFPELSIDQNNPSHATLELAVTASQPVAIDVGTVVHVPSVVASIDRKQTSAMVEIPAGDEPPIERLFINSLPPLTLTITLPEGYPATVAPHLSISVKIPWISDSKLRELEADGSRLWEDYGHDQVIFLYIDHLQQAAERVFDLVDEDRPLACDRQLQAALLDFDKQVKRQKFNEQTFDCGICLDPKKGSVCFRLSCGHVFCVQCLQNFYNSCITEGDLSSVKCLSPGCEKDMAAAVILATTDERYDSCLDPDELLQIPLPPDQVHRYVRLRQKAEIESNKYAVYCPRKWCTGVAKDDRKKPKQAENGQAVERRVWKDGDREEDMPAPHERLAICSTCGYAFCRVCLTGWHGEFVRCWTPTPSKLSREERASMEYLEKHSSPCPTCDAPCQKSHGCNHMICFKCKSHFCYLCSAWLQHDNPYAHYNSPGKGCYQRLWELESGDDGSDNDVDVLIDAHGDRGGEARRGRVAMQQVVDVDEAVAVAIHPPRRGRVAGPVARARANEDEHGNHNGGPNLEGLQHFLDLVVNDVEDEWDSDELDDDIEHLLEEGWGVGR